MDSANDDEIHIVVCPGSAVALAREAAQEDLLIRPTKLFLCLSLLSAASLPAAVPSLNLPATATGVQAVTTSPTTFSLTTSGISAGLSLTNTTYAVWCSNPAGFVPGEILNFATNPPSFFDLGGAATYNVFSSYATNLPIDGNAGVIGPVFGGTMVLTQAQEMQIVNYILNFPKGKNGTLATTVPDIQAVFWQVLRPNDGTAYVTGAGTDANALALYNDAIANGIGFIPGSGQVVAVILDPQTPGNSPEPYQGIIVPVKPTCLLSTLGPAGVFSILGLQGSNIQLSSGPLQVNGSVGSGVNGLIHLSGGAHLQSTLFADSSAFVQVDGGSSFLNEVLEPFAAIQNAALAESAAAASMAPTRTFGGDLTYATTITGNGGKNVIDINGQLHLSSGQNLTISGGPNDSFIFNISRGFQLDGGANIVLSGVSPNQVLFNFPGSGDQIQTSGKANTAGIFLAPQRTIQVNGGVHNSEFIAGGALSFQSNPVVYQVPACGSH